MYVCSNLPLNALYPQAVSLWRVPLSLVTRHTDNEHFVLLSGYNVDTATQTKQRFLVLVCVARQGHTAQGNSLWIQGFRGPPDHYYSN